MVGTITIIMEATITAINVVLGAMALITAKMSMKI